MLNARAPISRQGDDATSDCFLLCGARISFAAESHAVDTSDRVVAFTVAVSYGVCADFVVVRNISTRHAAVKRRSLFPESATSQFLFPIRHLAT
jgi:hypothetical protein